MHVNVHVDIDGIAVYEEEYGVRSGCDADLVYQLALPRMLELFERHDMRATFFVIGRDLEHERCREFCREAVARGHELGNHTWNHPARLHRLSFAEKELEVRRCGDGLSDLTGKKVVGFRAPGYYLDQELIEILIEQGYLYDTSVLPGFGCELMQAYLSKAGTDDLDKVIGRRSYLVASQAIGRLTSERAPGGRLLELPVSAAPFLRLPVHSTFIYKLGWGYFRLAMFLLRAFAENPVFLFHAVDALDSSELGPLAPKLALSRWPLEERLSMIGELRRSFGSAQFETTESWLGQLSRGFKRASFAPPASGVGV
jgi:peptidoglycan/xylan/chitin deacetylase (PgdA/CDA1 family)